MDNPTSPELKELIAVIRREHRRTQIIFGISIIILAVVIMFIAPGIIQMEVNSSQNTNSTSDTSALPSTSAQATSTATGTAAQ